MPVYKQPIRLKRPLNAYMLWLKQQRIQLRRENPGLRMTEIARLAGGLWRQLEDKSPWREQAARLMRDYLRKKKNSLPSFLTKRPLSSYMLWFKQNRMRLKCEHPELSMTEIASLAGEMWRQSNDRTQWQMMAEILKRKHCKDKSEYEAQIEKERRHKAKKQMDKVRAKVLRQWKRKAAAQNRQRDNP